MTPLERFRAAVTMERPDTVPLTLLAAGDFVSWFSGIVPRQYYGKTTGPKLDAQLRLIRAFPDALFFPGVYPDLGGVVEASALGCKVSFRNAGVPVVSTLVIRNMDELGSLTPPNPSEDGLMPKALAIYREMVSHVPSELKEEYGYGKGFALSLGPTEIACQALGHDVFVVAARSTPSVVSNLLEITTRTAEEWVKAQWEASDGKNLAYIIEDSVSLLSPGMFASTSLPYIKRLFNRLRGKDTAIIFHNCDKLDHLLSYVGELGANGLHFGTGCEIKSLKREVGRKVSLIGGISPFFITGASRGSVLKACRQAISDGGADGGYVLSLSGSIPVGVPNENLSAMVDTVKEYGRYPLV